VAEDPPTPAPEVALDAAEEVEFCPPEVDSPPVETSSGPQIDCMFEAENETSSADPSTAKNWTPVEEASGKMMSVMTVCDPDSAKTSTLATSTKISNLTIPPSS